MKKILCLAVVCGLMLSGCTAAMCNKTQIVITNGNMAIAQTRATATAINELNPGSIPKAVWDYLDKASIGLAMAQAAHDVACQGR